jgi:hypothetical protein
LAVLIAIAWLCSAPSLVSAYGSPAQDGIQSIRQSYAAINKNIRKYKRVKKRLSGFSAEGGEMTAYLKGSNIVKVVANFYGESGKAYEEYYYQDGKLIFVYRKDSTYTKHMSGRVARTREDRFYFNDGQLIRWVGPGGKQVPSSNDEYQKKQADYIDTARLFTEGVNSQKSVIEAP